MEEKMRGIDLSERAAEQVRKSLAGRGESAGVRLAVRPSGCSGMAYKMEFAPERAEGDFEFGVGGARVYVDAKSMAYLEGCRLDYVREGLSEGFRFENPNETARCGCGESFSV